MARFAGQAFNNIRKVNPEPFLDISEVTVDNFAKYIAQQKNINAVLDASFARDQAKADAERALIEKNKRRFGFDPEVSRDFELALGRLNNAKRSVRRDSIPLDEPFNDLSVRGNYGKGRFLNIASDTLNQRVFDLEGELEAARQIQKQKELLRMLKLERFHALADENEIQSFNNMMERGLINAPIAENRVKGKRREKRRMSNISFIRMLLQENDEIEARKMQKNADKYFGRSSAPKQRGGPYGTRKRAKRRPNWDDAPLIPDSNDIPF